MANDISVKVPAVWERGGRVAILRMLTSLRKPCVGNVATNIQPSGFLASGFPKGQFDICDFMIIVKADGSIYMSVNQGQNWFVLFDNNSGAILVGSTAWWAGQIVNIPAGWLICDGDEVSQTTYADLYAVIGTTYGTAGSPGVDFVLPDFRSRHRVGVNDSETGINGSFTTRNRNDGGGLEAHTLIESEIAGHVHGTNPAGTVVTEAFAGVNGANAGAVNSSSTGGDGSHENQVPYLMLIPIIKT